MKSLLAIDIGNTNITLGIFRGVRLIRKAKIPTRDHSKYNAHMKRVLKTNSIDRVVITSVVPNALSRLKKTLNIFSKCGIAVTGVDVKVPIKNSYKVKSQVGQDRLVNAFAARRLYGTPCVIIDFGTAITFDIVSERGEYLGGLILPGIELSLSSLYERTALLPKVRLAPAKHIIGKDTVESMRGGILFGFGAMCDALIAKYRKILGRDLKVIATGGNASLIKRYTDSIQTIDEDLTLKGLRLISETMK